RRTVVRLADAAAVAPAPALRSRVMEQIAVTPQARKAPRTPGHAERGGPPRSRLWLAAAAVLAVVSVGLGGLAWSQYRSAEDARRTTAAITRILADRTARSVTQTLPNGASAKLVVAQDR